jgi:DNA-binding NtrC family response regulator
MRVHWRGVVNRLLDRGRDFLRKLEQFRLESRTVLAVTDDERCRMSLRVLALEQGWHLLFASSVEDALLLRTGSRPCVLIYDREMPGDWRAALRAFAASPQPAIPIVLAAQAGGNLRQEVVNCGGYDAAGKPVEGERLVRLVNGALALAESIEELEWERAGPAQPTAA